MPTGVQCDGCKAWSSDPNAMVHRSGCPYGGGGPPPGRDPTPQRPMTPDEEANQALCLLFPLSAAGGVVFGGIWHVKRLGGGFKGKSAIRSWSDYITDKYPLKDKGASGGFWARIGGLPFLVLYPVTWSLGKAGVGVGWCAVKVGEGSAWLGQKIWQGVSWPPKQVYYAFAGRPDEKPQPTKRQLELADFNFRQLRAEEAKVLAEAKAARRVAAEKRDALLDELITDDPDLQKVLAAEGLDAARARATKKLDAYLQSYRERAKIRQSQQELIKEMDKTISKADQQLFEDGVGIVLDQAAGRLTKGWQDQLDSGKLTQAARHDLRLKLNLAKWADRTKTAQDNYYDLKDLGESVKKAEAGDYEARLEAHEKTGRMLIGWLDKVAPGKAGTVGLTAMDAAYSATAHLMLGNVASNIRNDMARLQTARPREDALAQRWSTIQSYGKFAANTERVAGIRMDYFTELEKKHGTSATGKEGSK
ncbi:MAG TPA: hypothetical protein PK280_13155 [Planctomycetota bacterium]|nr:hypothetical protein [Planctomycetota bacterium]